MGRSVEPLTTNAVRRLETECGSAAEADFDAAGDRRAVLKLYEGSVRHTALTLEDIIKFAKLSPDRAQLATEELERKGKLRLYDGVYRPPLTHDPDAVSGVHPVPPKRRPSSSDGTATARPSARRHVAQGVKEVALQLIDQRGEVSAMDLAEVVEGDNEKLRYARAYWVLNQLHREGVLEAASRPAGPGLPLRRFFSRRAPR